MELKKEEKNKKARPFFIQVMEGCIVVFVLLLLYKSCTDRTTQLEDIDSRIEVTPPKDKLEPDTTTSSLNKQLTPGAVSIEYHNQTFNGFIVDIRSHQINFFFKDELKQSFRTIGKVKSQVEDSGDSLIFAMNAGIFDAQNVPEGLFVNHGEAEVALNLEEGEGNFYLKPNGVFYILKNGQMGILPSEEYANKKISAHFATQSGPLLMRNDSIHPAFNKGSTNRFIRNGVGVISKSKVVFLISDKPVNFYDFSMVFKEQFGCKDALYLDGAISQIYLPELGENNLSSDFAGIIGVLKK